MAEAKKTAKTKGRQAEKPKGKTPTKTKQAEPQQTQEETKQAETQQEPRITSADLVRIFEELRKRKRRMPNG